MERREFIRKSLTAGLLTGIGFSFGKNALLANTVSDDEIPYDLVAVRNGEPEQMYKRAIEAMGGISKYVKKGQRVVIKPNIAWDVKPELAANTNPTLVKAVVESCLEAGAKSVYAFDHPCDNWKKTYKTSGIENAVKEGGGDIVPASSEKYFEEVDLPHGKRLTSAKVHEKVFEADVFINIPVLKHHGAAKLTISMKNLMGTVWDRGQLHRNDLQQCIADLSTRIKPDLNIVDAYRVMKHNGPRGRSEDDIVKMKFLVMSDDIVAADASAAKIFGMEAAEVPHIQHAHTMEVGAMNLDELEIGRIKL